MATKNPRAHEIGGRIKEAYLKAGYNRSQFARYLDVTYATAFNWDNGKKTPSAENLQAIAEATNVTVGWLLGDEKEPSGGGMKADPKAKDAALMAVEKFISGPLGEDLDEQDKADLRGFAWHALGSAAPKAAEIHHMLQILKMRRAGKDMGEDLAKR